MQLNFLNLDPSVLVPVNAIRQGKSFGFTITFEDNVTGEWEITFSDDEAGKTVRLWLTSGNGFTINSRVITVFVSKLRNVLKQGQTNMRISQTVGESSILAFYSPITVRP